MDANANVTPIMLDLEECGLADDIETDFEIEEEVELSFIQRLLKSRLFLIGGSLSTVFFIIVIALAFGAGEALGVPKLFSSDAGEFGLRDSTADNEEVLADNDSDLGATNLETTDLKFGTGDEDESLREFGRLAVRGDTAVYLLRPVEVMLASDAEPVTLSVTIDVKTHKDTGLMLYREGFVVNKYLTEILEGVDADMIGKFQLPGDICDALRDRLSSVIDDAEIDEIYIREMKTV